MTHPSALGTFPCINLLAKQHYICPPPPLRQQLHHAADLRTLPMLVRHQFGGLTKNILANLSCFSVQLDLTALTSFRERPRNVVEQMKRTISWKGTQIFYYVVESEFRHILE